jgi:CRISPR-associated endonuclease/helicase Cas3
LPDIPDDLRNLDLPTPPEFLKAHGAGGADRLVRRTELWIQLLFSALVDADWLDTEIFFDPHRTDARARFGDLSTLHARLSESLESKRLALSPEQRTTTINTARAEVLAACKAAADAAPGFFCLTAPTGAGKTLAGMEFALRHAERHGLDRVLSFSPTRASSSRTRRFTGRRSGPMR